MLVEVLWEKEKRDQDRRRTDRVGSKNWSEVEFSVLARKIPCSLKKIPC
jgi:hypothetical protein